MSKHKVIDLINKYGYLGAKRKMRMMGITKQNVWKYTDFLFRRV